MKSIGVTTRVIIKRIKDIELPQDCYFQAHFREEIYIQLGLLQNFRQMTAIRNLVYFQKCYKLSITHLLLNITNVHMVY